MDALTTLAARWHDEADVLERHGHERSAAQLHRRAEELETAWRRWWAEELTIAEAAEWTGYSQERLRELVREGTIPDNRPRGSQGEIRVRRCDLPRKPVGRRTRSKSAEDRREEAAASFLSSFSGGEGAE